MTCHTLFIRLYQSTESHCSDCPFFCLFRIKWCRTRHGNLLKTWLFSVGNSTLYMVYIQFADALFESGDPKCVKNQVALAYCVFSPIFRCDVSEGVEGMTPAPPLDDSGEIAGLKMIHSNYTLACSTLCVFERLSRAWTLIIRFTGRYRDLLDLFLIRGKKR